MSKIKLNRVFIVLIISSLGIIDVYNKVKTGSLIVLFIEFLEIINI